MQIRNALDITSVLRQRARHNDRSGITVIDNRTNQECFLTSRWFKGEGVVFYIAGSRQNSDLEFRKWIKENTEVYTLETVEKLAASNTDSALIINYREENGDRSAMAYSHIFTSTTGHEWVNLNGWKNIKSDQITGHYFVPFTKSNKLPVTGGTTL